MGQGLVLVLLHEEEQWQQQGGHEHETVAAVEDHILPLFLKHCHVAADRDDQRVLPVGQDHGGWDEKDFPARDGDFADFTKCVEFHNLLPVFVAGEESLSGCLENILVVDSV